MSLFNARERRNSRELQRALADEAAPPKPTKLPRGTKRENFAELAKHSAAQAERITGLTTENLTLKSQLKDANSQLDRASGIMGLFDSEDDCRRAAKVYDALKQTVPDGIPVEEFVRGIGTDDVTRYSTIPYKPKDDEQIHD